jgi:copper chaperone
MATFHVPDMTCDGCAKAVTAAVHRTDPAAEVRVDMDSKLVRVASGTAAATLAGAIEDAGFSPAEVAA